MPRQIFRHLLLQLSSQFLGFQSASLPHCPGVAGKNYLVDFWIHPHFAEILHIFFGQNHAALLAAPHIVLYVAN